METSAGFKSKMDKALFADATATSIGALFGTSNTTTYVESAAGIGAGGRTGLTSVVVAICFAISAFPLYLCQCGSLCRYRSRTGSRRHYDALQL